MRAVITIYFVGYCLVAVYAMATTPGLCHKVWWIPSVVCGPVSK